MSKKCPICGSINCVVEVGKAGAGKPWFTCLHCHTDLWEEEILPVTVFDHITQNVGMLANELVYYLPEIDKYTSEIIAVFYKDRDEAFAATIEELKKEYKK